MKMPGTQTLRDQEIPHHNASDADASGEEDPEHRISTAVYPEMYDQEIDLLQIGARGPGETQLEELLDDVEVNVESIASKLDSEEFNKALDNLEFRNDLRRACQWAFNRYRQSTHASWEDLQQEVLMRFGRWLPDYREEAKKLTVLIRIATNVLIDAKRRETAKRRDHEEIDLEEHDFERVDRGSWTKIEDRIFLRECRNRLCEAERQILDEYFVEGRSLRQLATKHGVSAPAISKRLGRIVTKLHEHRQKGTSVRIPGKAEIFSARAAA